jgi:hypothetical protein
MYIYYFTSFLFPQPTRGISIEPRGIRRFYQLPDDSGKPKCGESNKTQQTADQVQVCLDTKIPAIQ